MGQGHKSSLKCWAKRSFYWLVAAGLRLSPMGNIRYLEQLCKIKY